MSHTKEPWAQSHNESGHYDIIEVGSGEHFECIAQVHYVNNEPGGRGEADAKRIVSCVNACTGIDDPEKVVPELQSLLGRMCDAYELLCQDTGKGYHESPSSVYAHARTLLAKVRS